MGDKFSFASFFQAGFECATGFNKHRDWIDQIAATQHELFVERDYAACAAAGFLTIREGIRWPLVDRGKNPDFRSVLPFVRAANRHGLQIIWDLFHYGYPPALDPFSDEFVLRFAEYCFECARFLKARIEGPLCFTPVNEPSYLAWSGGEAGEFAPHLHGKAFELKAQLVRTAVAGIDAIFEVCPDAVIVNADPICRQVVPRGRPDLEEQVHWFNEIAVPEAMDMLSGRLLPELGGSKTHLGILGINYYWTNQWEAGRPEEPLLPSDDRLTPFGDILRWAYRRYGCDISVTETSHGGPNRAPWLRNVVQEVSRVLEEGLPLRGVCLYPILGMPEWHCRSDWAQLGLWDLVESEAGLLERKLHVPLYEELQRSRGALEKQRFHAVRQRSAARLV